MTIPWEEPPLPQVGAVLCFDSALPYDEEGIKKGSKHWQLDGSCVLISPTHALGVRHTLSKPGLKAVFLPGEGILPFTEVQDELNGERKGDYLGLVPLGDEARRTPPLPWEKIRKRWGKFARIAGYGRWRRGDEVWPDGIQRRVQIVLAEDHGHLLDLDWWAEENRDLSAGLNNSGGPLLWGHDPDDFEVIAINREREVHQGKTLQMASWIGDTRDRWLRKRLDNPQAMAKDPLQKWRRLEIKALSQVGGGPGDTWVKVPVPPGARTARATLSATPGLRLQMGLTQDEEPEALLAHLCETNTASGRFLVRPVEEADFQLDGSDTLIVAVAPVRIAPEKAPAVEAQVCVRFAK